MIYIVVGNDIKKRNDYLGKILLNREFTKLATDEVYRELLLEYGNVVDLFGQTPSFVIDSILEKINLSAKDLNILQESKTIFIFLEDKLKAVDEKKYKKYVEVEHFDEKKISQTPKINTFVISDAFARRDKVNTWIFYCEAIEGGAEPELISGILFWKIKTMILNGSNLFSINELKNQSSRIVSLYHKAHRGECDFSIGLEQFILTSLSK